MTTKGLLVMRNQLGGVAAPRVVADFVIAESSVNLEVVIGESLRPLWIVDVSPLVDVFLGRSPMSHDKISGNHREGRILLFHGIDDEPECVLPSLLWVFDIEVEEIGNTHKGPRLRFYRLERQGG